MAYPGPHVTDHLTCAGLPVLSATAGGTQKQEWHTQRQQGRHEGLGSQDPSRGSTRLQRPPLLIPCEGQSGPQVVTAMSPCQCLQEDRGGPDSSSSP